MYVKGLHFREATTCVVSLLCFLIYLVPSKVVNFINKIKVYFQQIVQVLCTTLVSNTRVHTHTYMYVYIFYLYTYILHTSCTRYTHVVRRTTHVLFIYIYLFVRYQKYQASFSFCFCVLRILQTTGTLLYRFIFYFSFLFFLNVPIVGLCTTCST